MRRPVARRLLAATAATALAATMGVTALTTTASAAVAGSPTGYATQNGGTTGGAGGQTVRATTGTQIHAALCNRAADDTPITIEVEGTINHGNTAKVSGDSCNTAAGVIELKQVSNVTIVGVGNGATFDQLGIHLREASNIIIQNVTVKNVKKSGSPTSNGGDAIGMESGVRNVWVDHVTLEASGGESEGYDGLFDMKAGVQYVTLSYSILRNSGRGGLIGSSESDTSNGFVTFHHNKYENLDSRTPLLRGGIAHIYNNHYVHLNESGINSRAGARAKVENNYFEDSKDVLGTFYTDQKGTWQVAGNVLDNVTWSSPSGDIQPAGPNLTSTTSVSIPYAYTLDGASCVPNLVNQTAGANKGLKVSDGSCTPQTPDPDPTDPTDPTDPGPVDPTDPPEPGAETIYVAPNGTASAAGTLSAPTTLPVAIERVASGGEIFLRGGTYNLSSTVTIEPGNDGTSGDRTLLSAYPGERPVLNFSAQAEDPANRGLAIGGDWWHVYGIVVEHAGDNGILLGGSNNVIERVVTRYNHDTGLQLSRLVAGAPASEWPSNNLILSSESHDNADSDGEDADGFAAKLTSGPGNVFRHTVSHNNIDDGWDLYTKSDTGPIGPVTIENSLAYENGTLSDGGQAGNGDRNGYKLGGEDIKVDHVVRNSFAVDNGKHGFTDNSNPGSITVSGNVAVGNAERNFSFDAGTHRFSGNVSCDSGANDKTVGTDAGGNSFWSGSNGSACSAYDGELGWSFAADGSLRVTFGGEPTNPTDPTDPTDPTGPPSGTNLSIGAGADGSSKASGTSYGNAIDGSTATWWSPSGSTGTVSVKWGTATTVGRVVVKEAAGGGSIGTWRLVNNDTGAVLKTGSGAGTITFTATSLKKINLEITGASGTPRVAELETYAG
ncbi:polysaccharide lyase family 1 protein [Cellulosimicrobium sp. SH8]|uniref:pectate lyase family protein n=1 Tax=Cellulosimicrobium sp. SH8 TaxID=2952936 RepID=UPI0021F3C69D|nr:polysaccharide lyase family 1 protein [Cellulosimicrobium sp. SH8]